MENVDKEILDNNEPQTINEQLPKVRVYPMGGAIVFEVGDISHAFAKGTIAVKKIKRKGEGALVAIMAKQKDENQYAKGFPTTVLTFKAEQMGCKNAQMAINKIIPLMI